MVCLTMMVFGGQPLVIGPIAYTYVRCNSFEHFSASKCQHFERTERTLWILLLQYNALHVFPRVPFKIG